MKTKDWIRQKWSGLKRWVIALLASLGIIVGGVLYAETVTFTYTRADAFDDGSPMTVDEIQFTRLYCGGVMVAEEAGADQNIQADLGIGTHECYATHVDIWDRESIPSNLVQRVVDPPGTGPNPPVIDP